MSFVKRIVQLTLLCFLTVIQACNSKNDDTISFDQVSPEKARHQVNVDSEGKKPETNQRPKASVFMSFADSLIPNANWQKWDTLLFPDRFGAVYTEKWIVKNDQDSLILLQFEFKDSLRTKNAFFNWLDCFGANCKSYTVGANMRIPRRNAIVLMDEQSILYVESNKKYTELSLRNQLETNLKKQQWIFAIEIPKKGKTSWKRIDKGIEKPILRNDEDSE